MLGSLAPNECPCRTASSEVISRSGSSRRATLGIWTAGDGTPIYYETHGFAPAGPARVRHPFASVRPAELLAAMRAFHREPAGAREGA